MENAVENWSVKELCERFGCSRMALYRWEKSGRITFKRIGRRVFIDPAQFQEKKILRLGSRFFVDVTK